MVFLFALFHLCLSADLYIGSWDGSLPEFTSNSGLLYLFNTTSSNLLYFCLYNGKWKSDDMLCFNSTLKYPSSSNANSLKSSSYYTNTQEIHTELEGKLYISKNQNTLNASGEIHSSENQVKFSFNTRKISSSEYYSSAYIFLIIFTIVKTLDFYACKNILYCCSSRVLAQSLSLSTAILSSCIDLFYMLWALELSGDGEITLMQMLVINVISLAILREKSKIFDKIVRSQSLNRRRHGFFTYLIIACLYISTLNSLYYLNVIVSNIVYVTQLIKNYKKVSIPKHFIAIPIIDQLIFTLYFTLFSDNFLIWEPNYALSAVCIALVSTQLIFLMKFVVRAEINPDTEALLGERIPISGNSRIDNIGSACSICLCEYGTIDVVVTNCGHAFHNECIQGWIRINAICPVCRNEVLQLLRYY